MTNDTVYIDAFVSNIVAILNLITQIKLIPIKLKKKKKLTATKAP